MSHRILFVAVLGVLLAAPLAFAGCASEAYSKSCASCPFDENGKMDQSCSSGYKSSGTACVSTSYPIMAAKYANGECPEVDACAAELSSCQAQYESGDDRTDCQEGSVSVCYASADACVKQAAIKCGEIEKQCPGSGAGLILLLLGVGFVKIRAG